ncbi:MAG: glycosidase [Chloroflexi bacterium]|nr:glycosidase [Chloroflexota bacterium]
MKLHRHPSSPILTPNPEQTWESGAVFNPGATRGPDGQIYLLYRAVNSAYTRFPDRHGYDNYVSSIGCASSEDGIHFSRFPYPVIAPSETYERYGCEDPRVSRVNFVDHPLYLITYTALSTPAFSGQGDRVALASTEDFRTFQKHGIIIPELQNKDTVIFPELVAGRVAMLHRVMPDIQIVYLDSLDALMSPDEEFWRKYRANLHNFVVMRPTFEWESDKIGGGCPPIKTEKGWLFIYHAKDDKGIYRVGAALLDLDAPDRVIARSPIPILEPETDYERFGDVDNVVFPQGAVVIEDILYIYYGAADKVCGLATAPLAELVDFVAQFSHLSLEL